MSTCGVAGSVDLFSIEVNSDYFVLLLRARGWSDYVPAWWIPLGYINCNFVKTNSSHPSFERFGPLEKSTAFTDRKHFSSIGRLWKNFTKRASKWKYLDTLFLKSASFAELVITLMATIMARQIFIFAAQMTLLGKYTFLTQINSMCNYPN